MTTPASPFTARLRYATITTTRFEDSVRFYEEILGLARTTSADDFVQLDAGATELCVDLDDGTEFSPQLTFAVDDIEAAFDHLQNAGIEIIAGGPNDPWFMVRDPDGNDIAFQK